LPLGAQVEVLGVEGVTLAAGAGTVIEGSPPENRFVILRWDSLEQLKNWRDCPEYVAAHKNGTKYAKFTVVAVPGAQ
jgi:heme-degrading monooxygenase HmoA